MKSPNVGALVQQPREGKKDGKAKKKGKLTKEEKPVDQDTKVEHIYHDNAHRLMYGSFVDHENADEGKQALQQEL